MNSDKNLNCEYCDCIFPTRSNYERHVKTKKHLKIKQKKELELSSKLYMCQICSKKFAKKYNYERHCYRTHNGDNDNIANIEDSDDLIKDKNSSYKKMKGNEYNQSLELLKMSVELEKYKSALREEKLKHENDCLKREVKILTKNTKFSNDIAKEAHHLANNAIHTTGKAVGALNYVKMNYPNAPDLKKIDNYTALCQHNKLMSNLLFYTRKGTISNYFGDFLIKTYKKDIPNEQSLWSTDISRLSFIVKELLKNKSDWRYDKKGLHVQNIIVKPLLEYIKEILQQYIDNIHRQISGKAKIIKQKCGPESTDDPDYNSSSESEDEELDNTTRMHLVNNQKVAMQLITEIDNKNLAKSVVRYMSPHLSLLQDKT